MPPLLPKVHHKLDAAVDATNSRKSFKTDAERVAFRFERHRELTSLLPAEPTKPKCSRRAEAWRSGRWQAQGCHRARALE